MHCPTVITRRVVHGQRQAVGGGLGRSPKAVARTTRTQILCIGCLEKRIGRTLMACDFTECPVNDPSKSNNSQRLRSRLTATK
jgi:hypothetical protein